MNPIVPLFLVLGSGTPEFANVDAVFASSPRRALAFRRALEHFSARWSVRFERVAAPRSDAPARARDTELAERFETLLDSAREALGALDVRETTQLLGEAERLIRAHPELPQAAWLRAEAFSLAAELAEQTGQGSAAELRARAAALEGTRAARFGTRSSAVTPDGTSVQVMLRGVSARDVTEWDSVVTRAPFQTSAGEHVLRVLRGERLLWAGWVTVSPAAPPIELALPAVTPCSADELDGTLDGDAGPLPPEGVRCPRWAVGRARRDGELELALCYGSRCGAWHARRVEPAPFRGPAHPQQPEAFPLWASYALAGAGTVALTSLFLIAAGSFEAARTRERWEYGGLQTSR